MGDTERPELNLSQDRQFQAIALCATCQVEIFAGPPLCGAEISISQRLIEYALPPLQFIHANSDGCRNAKLIVQVNELQPAGPLTRPDRRHLRIVK